MSHLRTFVTEQVTAAFPGQFNLPFAQTSNYIGFAHQTARNQLVAGQFPLKTIKIGGKRFIPAPVLVDYLVQQLEAAGFEPPLPAVTPADQPARRPGRPRKQQQGGAAQ